MTLCVKELSHSAPRTRVLGHQIVFMADVLYAHNGLENGLYRG